MGFVDTNVLIYAVSPSPQEADKRRRAQELLERGDLTLSVQVLQEFYHQVTRPNRTDPLTESQAMGFLESIDGFPVQPVTLDLFHSAVSISRRFKLSYWDGAILAAARAAGCADIVRAVRHPDPGRRTSAGASTSGGSSSVALQS